MKEHSLALAVRKLEASEGDRRYRIRRHMLSGNVEVAEVLQRLLRS